MRHQWYADGRDLITWGVLFHLADSWNLHFYAPLNHNITVYPGSGRVKKPPPMINLGLQTAP